MNAYTVIRGGLGNQLFQYARLRSFAIQNKAQDYYDLKNGFRFDFRFGNSLHLNRFNLKLKKVSQCHGNILWFSEKIGSKFSWKIADFTFQALRVKLLRESSNHWQNDIYLKSDQNFFLSGYWQSPKYFESVWNEIGEDFIINQHINPKVIDFAKRLNDSNSLAIGIRNYEETKDVYFYARDGKVKTYLDWKNQINRIQDEMVNPQFYVFGTQISSEQLTQMGIKGKKYEVIPFSEFRDPVDSMFLFSAARHQMFNNSTFYWWGAFLRNLYFQAEDQEVYASDNFLNLDCVPSHWRVW